MLPARTPAAAPCSAGTWLPETPVPAEPVYLPTSRSGGGGFGFTASQAGKMPRSRPLGTVFFLPHALACLGLDPPGGTWAPRSGVQAALAAGPGPVRAVASRGGTGGPHQPVVPGVSAVTDAGFWKGSAGWQRRARGVGSECQGRSSDRGSPPGGRSSSRETPTATTGRCARTTPGRRTTPTWSSRCRCPRTC